MLTLLLLNLRPGAILYLSAPKMYPSQYQDTLDITKKKTVLMNKLLSRSAHKLRKKTNPKVGVLDIYEYSFF